MQIIFHWLGKPHFMYYVHIGGHLDYIQFGTLWIMVIWAFELTCLCGHMYSLIFGRFLGVKLLHHMLRNWWADFKMTETLLHLHHNCMRILVSVWWVIFVIPYFNHLDIIPFSSLNIFITVTLKSLVLNLTS